MAVCLCIICVSVRRKLQLSEGGFNIYERSSVLFHDRLYTGHHTGDVIVHHVLAGMERRPGTLDDR